MTEKKPVETLPPFHDHRTIVLCFDGTQNKISNNFSNVAQLFGLLDRSDRNKQLVYYQTGIGTYTSSKFLVGPISSRISMTIDSMIASSIADHVKEGYRYLMDNYVDGDRICIFGFSRGAHTARVLAGMIHKVGLLPVGNHRHIKYAWEVYCLDSPSAWKSAFEFKTNFATTVPIEFVGIWDSVGSVGLTGSSCRFSRFNTTIKTFRHALALDERRARFQANTWRLTADTDEKTKVSAHEPQTDVEEVWFAGCHSDVGGGNCANGERHSLSRISLRWMIRQCFATKTGILFVPSALQRVGLDPTSLYPEVRPRPPPVLSADSTNSSRTMENMTEEEEDLFDSKCEINDELANKPFWWLLETIPIKKGRQLKNGTWSKSNSLTMNLGRARNIACQRDGLKVHRTVKMKREDTQSDYKPKPKFKSEPEWVA